VLSHSSGIVSLDNAIARGYLLVNTGAYAPALALFECLLNTYPGMYLHMYLHLKENYESRYLLFCLVLSSVTLVMVVASYFNRPLTILRFSHPKGLVAALMARGSALAMSARLPEAVACFTTALEHDPSLADSWKRRGQVY
jgi:tetratricopeptide (TPR) repeat protein